jgi:hypothetical protein
MSTLTKKVKQTISGSIKFEAVNDTYFIEECLYNDGCFNVRSLKGINHEANGLIYGTLDEAFKAIKSYIKNDND